MWQLLHRFVLSSLCFYFFLFTLPAASLPSAPTELPVTGSAVSLGKPAYLPVDTPTNAVTPQRVPVQQKLLGPQLPQAQPWTGNHIISEHRSLSLTVLCIKYLLCLGSKEPKHSLKGFFGNGYHGKISDAASIH